MRHVFALLLLSGCVRRAVAQPHLARIEPPRAVVERTCVEVGCWHCDVGDCEGLVPSARLDFPGAVVHCVVRNDGGPGAIAVTARWGIAEREVVAFAARERRDVAIAVAPNQLSPPREPPVAGVVAWIDPATGEHHHAELGQRWESALASACSVRP